MIDSFELALSNPLTQEDWDKLTDVELEKTEKMWFKTPSGKKVEFIPLSVLNDIKAEIAEEKNDHQAIGEAWSDDTAYGLQLALDTIDKHLKEGNGQEWQKKID